jgi:aspartate oxidase
MRELENEIGCFFDRNPDGTLHGKAFAGQTFDRTVHKGDLTGIEIINRLMEQVWARPIRRLEEHRAARLLWRVANADHHAANVLPVIREIQRTGASLHQIADALNARGIGTPRGGRWYAKSVKRNGSPSAFAGCGH